MQYPVNVYCKISCLKCIAHECYSQLFDYSTAIDFINNVIPVILNPGSQIRGATLNVPVRIVDDEINEKTETFVGILQLVNAVDPSTVRFRTNTTQLIINDNDSELYILNNSQSLKLLE